MVNSQLQRPKNRLCVDIDNVIAKTDEVMREIISDFTDGRVNLQYEDVVEFDYFLCRDNAGCAITREEWHEIHEQFSKTEYILSLPTIESAEDSLRKLSRNYYIHIATSRLPTAWRATVEWLENRRIVCHSLHFATHGEKHSVLGKFTAAIEDHYEQALGFSEAGTQCFLLDHPWNQKKPEPPGITRVIDWRTLTEILLDLADY